MFTNFWRKPYVWGKSCSRDMDQNRCYKIIILNILFWKMNVMFLIKLYCVYDDSQFVKHLTFIKRIHNTVFCRIIIERLKVYNTYLSLWVIENKYNSHSYINIIVLQLFAYKYHILGNIENEDWELYES